MLKKTDFSGLEPLLRLRQLLTSQGSIFLDGVMAAVGSIPADQPHAATVVLTLVDSFLQYSAELGPVKAPYEQLLRLGEELRAAVAEHRTDIQGHPPRSQLDGRRLSYPVWTLAMELTDGHRPLRIALGAEVARALVQRRPMLETYCTKLRRDIPVLGRHASETELALPEDLEALGFGAKWIASFRTTDRLVRRMVSSRPPSGPDAPDDLGTADLIRRLSYRFTYPAANDRKGIQHDGCVRPEVLREVARAVRCGVESGCDQSFIHAASMLTGFSSKAVVSIPLVAGEPGVVGVALADDGHCFFLDLNALFPSRVVPDASVARLFEHSGSIARFYCPAFFAREVIRRKLRSPHAATLGDLVNTSVANARQAMLARDHSKLYASLARCIRSMANTGLWLGADRLTLAFQTWRFSIINSARAYYARLTHDDVLLTADSLFGGLDWLPVADGTPHEAFGSRCVLTAAGVAEIFSYLASACQELKPGRRANLERLLEHHEALARYTGALLAFSLGAREASEYGFMANELCLGQSQVVLRDKGKNDRVRFLPVPLNGIVREQIRQWTAHCAALARRLHDECEEHAIKLRMRLEAIASSAPVHLLVGLRDAEPASLGSADIWGSLPDHLHVPANVGRHFWQNALRAHGHNSRDIDRWMRHTVLMLDPNDSDQDSIASAAFSRIAATQEKVLSGLGIRAISGLRRAG